MTVVVTIAGSDSSGGGGLQADLRVFHCMGVHGAAVVTALTAQTTAAVERVHLSPPRFVAAQLDAVARDLAPAAAKTGMLARAAIVHAVADRIRRRRIPNLVVDPVMVAKDGTELLEPRGVEALRHRLLPLARVVTPNIAEAERLSGLPIRNLGAAREAARRILAGGVEAVVIKGGHLPGEPVDLLAWRDGELEFPGVRLPGPPVRGTGCHYSAALCARLALGDDLPAACSAAKELVAAAIAAAVRLGRGSLVAVPPCGALHPGGGLHRP